MCGHNSQLKTSHDVEDLLYCWSTDRSPATWGSVSCGFVHVLVLGHRGGTKDATSQGQRGAQPSPEPSMAQQNAAHVIPLANILLELVMTPLLDDGISSCEYYHPYGTPHASYNSDCLSR